MSMGARKNLRAPLSTVLDCAHANKETKTSLVSAEESFGVFINRASREKDCLKSVQASNKIKCSEKEG